MNAQLSLLPDEPVEDHRRPREPIARAACIEGPYRRWLKRKWGAGPLVAWAMLNPSTADGKADDPTLWRIMGFSYRWGYGGLVVANVYPFISSSPAVMRQWRASFADTASEPDEGARSAWHRNTHDCATLFADCALVMAAWGAHAERADVAQWIGGVEAQHGQAIDWHCLGRTGDGSPKHPLARGVHRVPDNQRAINWRMPS